MAEWNPHSIPCCVECPHYVPKGQFIYQLEMDKRLCRCRYLAMCRRATKLATQAIGLVQQQKENGGQE